MPVSTRTWPINRRTLRIAVLASAIAAAVTTRLLGAASSPDGTTLPPATEIVDSTGAVWTIGSNGMILRNGSQANGGWGSKLLWTTNTIYAYGTDSNWWRWTGTGWVISGAASPVSTAPSPDGTTVPTMSTQIIDNAGAVWTIAPNAAILRNGTQASGGWGTRILWTGGIIYAYGSDSNWWRWTGGGWLNVGPTVSGSTAASPDGAMVPTVSQIVDNNGGVWTVASNTAILRNGAQVAG